MLSRDSCRVTEQRHFTTFRCLLRLLSCLAIVGKSVSSNATLTSSYSWPMSVTIYPCCIHHLLALAFEKRHALHAHGATSRINLFRCRVGNVGRHFMCAPIASIQAIGSWRVRWLIRFLTYQIGKAAHLAHIRTNHAAYWLARRIDFCCGSWVIVLVHLRRILNQLAWDWIVHRRKQLFLPAQSSQHIEWPGSEGRFAGGRPSLIL